MSQRDFPLRVLRRESQNSTGDHLQEAKLQTLMQRAAYAAWDHKTEHSALHGETAAQGTQT